MLSIAAVVMSQERGTSLTLPASENSYSLSVLEIVYSFIVFPVQRICIVVDYPRFRAAFWIPIIVHEGFLFILAAYKAYVHVCLNHFTYTGLTRLLFRDSSLLFAT